MTFKVPQELLLDMLAGWRKVADRYGMTIYVFKHAGGYGAFTNRSQGIGELVEELVPTLLGPVETPTHGRWEIASAEPASS
jgi:hypothetical protein